MSNEKCAIASPDPKSILCENFSSGSIRLGGMIRVGSGARERFNRLAPLKKFNAETHYSTIEIGRVVAHFF
jgi:hypothetical protein